MFGRRSGSDVPQPVKKGLPAKAAPQAAPQRPESAPAQRRAGQQPAVAQKMQAQKGVPTSESQPVQTEMPAARRHSEEYYDVKTTVFNALIDTIDLTQLAKLELGRCARRNPRHRRRDHPAQERRDVDRRAGRAARGHLQRRLGYGPLEPLLARDDIADIMVNGADTTYIEVNGKVQQTGVRFADNAQLMNICQRIVSQVGRRVDEFEPHLRRASS